MQRRLKACDMLFLDEAGVSLSMTNADGRAPCSERLSADAPINRGISATVVAAIGQGCIVTPRVFTGSLTPKVFAQYLRERLLPEMRPARVLVMDNDSVHNTAAVQKALADFGVQPAHLPPYSPEYNPIEPARSKIKARLQKAMPRQFKSLVEALGQAMRTVTSSDIEHWIRHCGYGLNP